MPFFFKVFCAALDSVMMCRLPDPGGDTQLIMPTIPQEKTTDSPPAFALDHYRFELPTELIAQHPAPNRDASRLLVAGCRGPIHDRKFTDLPAFLAKGDVLVLNRTRVIPARCHGRKPNGTRIEVFFLGMPTSPDQIQVLIKPSRRVSPGTDIIFDPADARLTIQTKQEGGRALARASHMEAVRAIMEKSGEIPLPPYVRREFGPDPQDATRYQTVYGDAPGAVAAPTAGLHFTNALMAQLEAQGVELVKIVHHVGIGTFRPVSAEDIRDHHMDAETYEIGETAARALNVAREQGRRIIAVGTTSTRCLEANVRKHGTFQPGRDTTDLFLYPPCEFLAIDALITNFHLPGSTLILLVSALMGRDRIFQIYQHAIENRYRFYSYGDSMFLTRHDGLTRI